MGLVFPELPQYSMKFCISGQGSLPCGGGESSLPDNLSAIRTGSRLRDDPIHFFRIILPDKDELLSVFALPGDVGEHLSKLRSRGN